MLGFSLFGESNIETCINNLIHNYNEKYINVKYLNYSEMFGDVEFKWKQNILKNMNLFLPQVLVDKSYLDNLLDILNK